MRLCSQSGDWLVDVQPDLQGLAERYLALGDSFFSQGDAERANEVYRQALQLSRLLRSSEA